MEEKIPETLIVRYLSNEASSEEQMQLFEWTSLDAKHQKVFNEYCDLWGKSYKHPVKFDLQSGLQKLNNRLAVEEKIDATSQQSIWLKVAASLLILFVAGFSVFLLGKYSNYASALTWVEKSNPSGLKSTVLLSDGSVVRLNSSSTLRFPEKVKGMKREVYLNGEAFFEVKKDALRPFIIHTSGVQTRVLGTSFNIKSSAQAVEVAVATGKVKVTEGEESEILLPQEKVVYSLQDKKWSRAKTDLERELAWKNNILIIENKTIEEASSMLEEWYGVSFSFETDLIKNCRITGKYKNESLENVLRAIGYSTGIKFQLNNKEVTLSGEGCQ